MELLEKLSNARGPSGNEGEVREILIEAVKRDVDEFRVDTLGNLIARKKARGTRKVSAFRVMIAAHMDEVGFLITHFESNGHLRFSPVGGIDSRVLLAKVVLIGQDKIPGVIGSKPVHLTKAKDREQVVETDAMTIDIGAKSKEDAQRAAKLGDYATFATEFGEMGDGLLKGKALDDRTGCAILAEILKRDYPFELFGVFTVQEEVGLRGARVAAYAIEPHAAFALESTVCDDGPKTKDVSPVTRVGAGPAISIADGTMIADKRLVNLLIETAKTNRIPFQFKQAITGGTDAGRIHLSKTGVPSAAVSVPTRYIHSPVSLLSKKDLENTIALMVKALPGVPKAIGEQ
ncbi:MAG: M42 family metallopeptidase [Chloroflexi bacterium]|nr:M42 family metallopeptidase [Chloroflexota bacterium]